MSDLPKDWVQVPLKALGREIRQSVTPMPSEPYELYSVPTFPTGRPELLEGAAIKSGKRAVEPDDVLLCKINPRINRVWIVGEPMGFGRQIASTEYLVFRCGDSILPRYLMLFLQAPVFRDWIKLSVEGATGSHTRAKSGPILQQLIPVPPLHEQERIVEMTQDLLWRLEAAERYVDRTAARLQVLRRSILSQTAERCWPETTVGELLVDIQTGRSVRTPGHRAAPDKWGVIKVSAMTWGEFREDENKELPADFTVNPDHEIRPGDLLLSRANTSEYVGASVLVHETRPRLLLSDKSMRLVPKPDVDPIWLQLTLSSPGVREQMSGVATGTSDSMRNISQEKVRALQVRRPPHSVQQALANSIAEQLSQCDRLLGELHRVRQLAEVCRSSILAAAFSGRLTSQEAFSV